MTVRVGSRYSFSTVRVSESTWRAHFARHLHIPYFVLTWTVWEGL